MSRPIADQVRADELLERHIRLTCVTAVVAALTLAAMLVILAVSPSSAVWSAILGTGVLAVVVGFLARHLVELSAFAFRRKVH